jgi:hypothetical protein
MRVNSSHVPAATISPNEDHSAAQGTLDYRQDVKTIQPKLLAAQLSQPNAMAPASFLVFPGTGAPADCNSLPPGQMVAVSHQFRRRGDAVTMVQQPAQVAAGLAQGMERAGAE